MRGAREALGKHGAWGGPVFSQGPGTAAAASERNSLLASRLLKACVLYPQHCLDLRDSERGCRRHQEAQPSSLSQEESCSLTCLTIA